MLFNITCIQLDHEPNYISQTRVIWMTCGADNVGHKHQANFPVLMFWQSSSLRIFRIAIKSICSSGLLFKAVSDQWIRNFFKHRAWLGLKNTYTHRHISKAERNYKNTNQFNSLIGQTKAITPNTEKLNCKYYTLNFFSVFPFFFFVGRYAFYNDSCMAYHLNLNLRFSFLYAYHNFIQNTRTNFLKPMCSKDKELTGQPKHPQQLKSLKGDWVTLGCSTMKTCRQFFLFSSCLNICLARKQTKINKLLVDLNKQTTTGKFWLWYFHKSRLKLKQNNVH